MTSYRCRGVSASWCSLSWQRSFAPGEPSVYRTFIGSVPAGESDEEFAAAVEAMD